MGYVITAVWQIGANVAEKTAATILSAKDSLKMEEADCSDTLLLTYQTT
jgi:hypothetical protein